MIGKLGGEFRDKPVKIFTNSQEVRLHRHALNASGEMHGGIAQGPRLTEKDPQTRDPKRDGHLVIVFFVKVLIEIVDVHVAVAATNALLLRFIHEIVVVQSALSRRGRELLAGGEVNANGDAGAGLLGDLTGSRIVIVTLVAICHGCVDVGGRIDLGVIQEQEDRSKDGLGSLEGGPALGSLLSRHLIFAGGVEDRDTESAIGVDIRMVDDRLCESKRGGSVGVVGGERHLGLVECRGQRLAYIKMTCQQGQLRRRGEYGDNYLQVGSREDAVRIDNHQANVPFLDVSLIDLKAVMVSYPCHIWKGQKEGR